MNETFLKLYEEELGHVRELSVDFGHQYPKIAGRLGLSREGCDDPFVERMIEGFAYLAARVRTKLDAEYSNFAESLLESVYPQLLGPVPSMTIVELTPDEKLAGRLVVPRGSVLTSHLGSDEDTRCEFRTAHEVILQPLRFSTSEKARYYSRDLETLRLPPAPGMKAAIKLRISHSQNGKLINTLEGFDGLTIHVAGNMDAAGAVYEELAEHCTHIFLRPAVTDMAIPEGKLFDLKESGLQLTPVGFAREDALLPPDARCFDGYRLLREYSVLPQRFMFLKLHGPELSRFAADCAQDSFDIVFILNAAREEFARLVDPARFRLNATPAINLFPRRADPIRLTEASDQVHVVVDKTRPLAYEIYQVLDVTGSGDQLKGRVKFQPFYRNIGGHGSGTSRNFFTLHRELRRMTHQEVRLDSHFDYTGSEVYLGLVDSAQHLQKAEISTLSVKTW